MTIPLPAAAHVWLDFDGTITRLDVLDELIRRFAVDDSWLQAEAEWQAGRIGSRKCLSRQFAVVAADDNDLDRLLDDIPVDPGYGRLVSLLDRHAVPWTILSDGIDRFISRLAGTSNFRSNGLERIDGRLSLVCPHASAGCRSGSAHCKCGSIDALSAGRAGIYVGDGRSDLCPGRTVGCRFAKGTLAKNLAAEGLDYLPFESLDDVVAVLAGAWG